MPGHQGIVVSDVETPIVVHGSPTQPQIDALFRQIVLVVGPVLGVLGYKGALGVLNELAVIIGPLSGLIALVWGQVATWRIAKKAAAMARALSDDVAVTK